MIGLELLSPARNYESGIAAINCGADAVYIGAEKFSARSAAGNSLDDIAKLCHYAHLFRVKVYVAINTIIFDHELDEVRRMMYSLYHVGVDAFIIQDAGLLELDLPPLPLIASTQMHNYSLDHIQFLEKSGFKRVILARELTMEQISQISKSVKIELEAFVHGALCVSFSGHCYMSLLQGGRSANRGECAQPCRLSYSLSDKNGKEIQSDKHLLCLKDLNLSANLEQLIQAGITSFKIEGRLKDLAYVKNITAYYRQQLDKIISKNDTLRRTSSGFSSLNFVPDPERTFNRGYTSYFFNGRTEGITAFRTPKSIGKMIGPVISVGKDFLVVKSDVEFTNGDGFCFFNEQGKLCGFNINKVVGNKIWPNKMPVIHKGDILFRNFDHAFEHLLQKSGCERKIMVDLLFSEVQDGFSLEAIDEDGYKALAFLKTEKIKAINTGAIQKNIITQLSKSGETIFTIRKSEIKIEGDYFIPISKLNELRRIVLTELEQHRNEGYQRIICERKNERLAYPLKYLNYTSNVANELAIKFYRKHKSSVKEKALELQVTASGQQVMTTKLCLRYEMGECPVYKNKMVKFGTRHPVPWKLHNQTGSYRLEFDCDECVMKIFCIDDKKSVKQKKR